MNDIMAVSGNSSVWPPSGGLPAEDVRIADSQSDSMGERGAPWKLTRQEVEKGIEDMNKAISMLNRSLKFTVHEETGKLMVQVIEKGSNKVVAEIPPQILLDIEARIEKFIGILFDKKI
ncbi:flagellar protein FlaG [Mahella australiensis]|uniref:Flagellar protein FlaG protein n=1 Tax=Mahella australiensis (strain DSM 15567 / CIP 107919 / 50-1 BON) TaxID=697281 RepID=F3ZZ03_MAHA5|nr:flagellar protein FlaG [Mahella australiensis]AEE96762.1 flagellar protein FlaG protein [Mahella australiensis 50-1 BON]